MGNRRGGKKVMGGGAVLGLLLALNYYVKQAQFHVFGVTTIIIALITDLCSLSLSRLQSTR